MSDKIGIAEATDTACSLSIRNALAAEGYAVVICEPPGMDQSAARHLTLLDSVLGQIGDHLQVFDEWPAWRPIGVKSEIDPTRSQGVGESPLHMDFVNAEDPPDVVVLYCERNDVRGGGATILAPNSVATRLPPTIRKHLSQPVFRDGQVTRLHNIGSDINPFPILSDTDRWHFRYTGQLLRTRGPADLHDALNRLDDALRAQVVSFVLGPGEAVIIDQHRMVHGRGILGKGQQSLPFSHRRLIWQRFLRQPELRRDGLGLHTTKR